MARTAAAWSAYDLGVIARSEVDAVAVDDGHVDPALAQSPYWRPLQTLACDQTSTRGGAGPGVSWGWHNHERSRQGGMCL